ncbi:hypothetical protein AB7M17_008410 [Bradyrhizobium sp. USDA 377]
MRHVMRLSSGFVAPSAFAFLSTVLLCSPAVSQTATSSPTQVPSVTVDAPKQAARPKQAVNTGTSRPTSSTRHIRSATAQPSSGRTPSPAPGSPLARIAALEKRASSCNGGCQTSFRRGKDPWVGCSESGGGQPMHLSRRPAQTPSLTRTTWIASRPRCSWATTATEPTGSAAASPPATSFKSPTSSDRSASAGA